MGIENGGNLNQAEEAKELAPEGASKGKTLESKVHPERVEGNSLEVAEESYSELVAQEQLVKHEATLDPNLTLLEIGTDFDKNWVYYDNQDRAILRLKEGDIEELKTELQKALESGQITLSNEGFKRLDIPEEQKEIRRQLETKKSNIQALIQSNDNLPRDLREALQQEIDSDNVNRKLYEILERRINFISNRKRLRFLGIGTNELQVLESLREFIKEELTEYSQLQNSEQNIVDSDVIIKFQQLPQSLQQSIYSLENPTVENINEVIDQAIKSRQSYKTPHELIKKRKENRSTNIVGGKIEKALMENKGLGVSKETLQEGAKIGIIKYLKIGGINDVIKIIDEFNLSIDLLKLDEKIQEAAKEGIIHHLRYLDENNISIRTAKEIITEFSLEKKQIQEAAKEGVISNLNRGFYDDAIKIINEFSLSLDLLKADEQVQEAAKAGVIFILNNGFYDDAIKIINAFSLSLDLLKADEQVQEAVKEGVISNLNRGFYDDAIKIINEFSLSLDLLKADEQVQEAAKAGVIFILNNGFYDDAIKIINAFSLSLDSLKEDEQVQEALKEGVIFKLNRGFYDDAIKIINDFNISKEFMQQPLKEAFIQNLKYNKITKALDLVNEFNLNLTYFEVKAIEIFGIYLSYDIFFEIRDLENGVIGPELAKIGLTKAGKEGIQELATILQELKSEFTKHNPENIKFENSEFITNYFMSYTGYKDSEWGNTDRDSFLNSVQNTRNIKYKPLSPEFKVIETYQIRKKEKNSKIDKSIYRKDFLNRFSVLMEDIKLAKDNLENKKPLTNLVDQLNFEIKNIVQNLKIKSQELQDNPQAQIGLGKRIELLEKIKLRSIQDFQENFKILSSFSELDSILRQVVFTMGFAKNRSQLDKSLSEISVENPSVDDISWALNFVDHITNKETMAKYFTDKKATKKFEEKINPTALTEQMDLLQNGQGISGTTNITFSTHRDFYTEISGQIADACWASKYESILTEFPNFSSILMVKDKETQNERIVGSSLLIETKAKNGDDLLIIRGLNPTETTINSLDVRSYFEAVVDYAKKLADSTGKKLAISIDDLSGGHTTNRPLLFNYISNLKGTLKKVRLKNPSEANFNGYNLQGEVYLL